MPVKYRAGWLVMRRTGSSVGEVPLACAALSETAWPRWRSDPAAMATDSARIPPPPEGGRHPARLELSQRPELQ